MQHFAESEVRDALERYVLLRESIERGEAPWTAIADLFTVNAVFCDPAWGRVEGRNGIRHLFNVAMPGVDFAYPIDFTAVAGNWVVGQLSIGESPSRTLDDAWRTPQREACSYV